MYLSFASKILYVGIMVTMEYNLKYIFTTIKTDNPDIVVSWQKEEEALMCLDENQVDRLFSMQHASLIDFHQTLAK